MLDSKIIITTGYNCNNNCLFCYKNIHKHNVIKSTEEIKLDLREARSKNIKSVDFDGGEPTIRPDILTLLNYAREIGFKKISIVTNGRMFAYKSFCKTIVKAGATSILFSIHGHNSRLHDSLTRAPKSFEQAIRGIANVKELTNKLTIGANVVITQKNYEYLDEILKFFKKIGVNLVNLLCICPIGEAYKNYDLIPLFSKIAPFIQESIELNRDMDIKVHNIPFCFMRNYEKYIIVEAQTKNKTELRLPLLKPTNLGYLLGQLKVKAVLCNNCQYNTLCGGIWRNYLKVYGKGELENFENIIPPQIKFSYSCIKLYDVPALTCPVKTQKMLLKGEYNGLFYKDNNVLGYYELRDKIKIKDLRYIRKFRQIYVSKSDNWPEGLFSAQLNKKCPKCVYFKNKRCCGYFSRSAKNVAEESNYEQLLKRELNNLKGNVLDIGCGPVYHLKIFQRLARENKIIYYGIDPDEKMINALNSKIPARIKDRLKGII